MEICLFCSNGDSDTDFTFDNTSLVNECLNFGWKSIIGYNYITDELKSDGYDAFSLIKEGIFFKFNFQKLLFSTLTTASTITSVFTVSKKSTDENNFHLKSYISSRITSQGLNKPHERLNVWEKCVQKETTWRLWN